MLCKGAYRVQVIDQKVMPVIFIPSLEMRSCAGLLYNRTMLHNSIGWLLLFCTVSPCLLPEVNGAVIIKLAIIVLEGPSSMPWNKLLHAIAPRLQLHSCSYTSHMVVVAAASAANYQLERALAKTRVIRSLRPSATSSMPKISRVSMTSE